MSRPDSDLESAIVKAVLKAFNSLPSKSKPALQSNGTQTWVPLSGIVIHQECDADVECVALG